MDSLTHHRELFSRLQEDRLKANNAVKVAVDAVLQALEKNKDEWREECEQTDADLSSMELTLAEAQDDLKDKQYTRACDRQETEIVNDAENLLMDAEDFKKAAEKNEIRSAAVLDQLDELLRSVAMDEFDKEHKDQPKETALQIFSDLQTLCENASVCSEGLDPAEEHFKTALVAVFTLSALKGKIGELFIQSKLDAQNLETVSQLWLVVKSTGKLREVDIWESSGKMAHEVKCWSKSTIKSKKSSFSEQLLKDIQLVAENQAAAAWYHFLSPSESEAVSVKDVCTLFNDHVIWTCDTCSPFRILIYDDVFVATLDPKLMKKVYFRPAPSSS